MKTPLSLLTSAAVLSLGLLASSTTRAETIDFSTIGAFNDAFPTVIKKKMASDPSVSGGILTLHTGQTETGSDRSGTLTAYSDQNLYSASLDFSSSPLTITFENLRFINPEATATGSFGLTDTASGTIATGNGIYFVFTRASTTDQNTFTLVQSVNGTPTTLTTFWTGSTNGLGPNGPLYSSISLTVTATTWAVSYSIGGTAPVSVSGSWDSSVWNAATYIGLESSQNSSLIGKERYADLNIGSITFGGTPIPEPSSAIGLFGVAGLAFAALRRRTSRR